jgi:arylformamidase
MTLPDLFRTRDHVAEFDDYVELFAKRSAEARQRYISRLDQAYGPGEMEQLDLFFPSEGVEGRPLHLFVHGGYWRMFDKSDFSLVAATIVEAGGIAAIMNYDLMPNVRMESIVSQARAAARWLVDNARSFGGDPDHLSVSGHSAGGHLVCWLMTQDSPVRPRSVLSLSGLFDLEPLRQSFLQPLIGLTDDEVARYTPLSAYYLKDQAVHLMVGEAETQPFHQQAQQFQTLLEAQGCPARLSVVPSANHMSIVADLGDISTEPGRALAAQIRS